ncbi:MAG: hypothetical protein EYC70_10240 [Planctomycetota bacterium]|nr:MAG: hypothetical protein EYC70_10240 [Planctomycetota bacterium]
MPLFTVLPRKGDANAADAPAILRHIIHEPATVVMMILGRPPGIERILEVAIGRAEAAAQTRRVVHAPDPEVLEQATIDDIRAGKNHVSAAYGLRDTIAARLLSGPAKDKIEVEIAFALAEQQGLNPPQP